MTDMRDAKGRYTDLEVAAVEARFDWQARSQADLDWLMDHFNAQAIVLGVRADLLRAEIEVSMAGIGAFIWRRFPRIARVVLRATESVLHLLRWAGIVAP